MILKAQKFLDLLTREIYVYTFIKIDSVIWKKNKDSLDNAVDEIEKNFINVKNELNEDNLRQRNRYRCP